MSVSADFGERFVRKRSLKYGYYVGLIYPGKQGLRCPATLFVIIDVEVSVMRNGGGQ